jgi:hypothetical protein
MCDGDILALQLLADESTQLEHRQRIALPSQPYLIYILLKMSLLNSKVPLSIVMGAAVISLLYLDSAASNL